MYALLMHTGMYLKLSEPYNCDMVRKRLPVYKNTVYRTMLDHCIGSVHSCIGSVH